MRKPLQARLVDLDRLEGSWPLVGFALLTGRVSADIDFLAAKHAGHTFAKAVAAIYPEDLAELRQAARRLEWAQPWERSVLSEALPLAVAFAGKPPRRLSIEDLEALRGAIKTTPYYTGSVRHAKSSYVHSLGRLLYEARFVDRPLVHRRGEGPGNLPSRLSVVGAPEIRRVMLAYLEARQAVLKVATIRDLASSLASFGEFLSERYPELGSLADLERSQIEAFCRFLPTRRWRGQRACDRRVGPHTVIATLIDVRSFLDDITAWGWAEAPKRRLLFSSDVPRPPRVLPRALPPDVDAALMDAVGRLEDRFARIGLTVLRGAGLRLGELLDLELDCVCDYGPAGNWLRVPLGKLDEERSVPLDEATLAAIEEWKAHRGTQRALPRQSDGRMVDFLFVERGRRPGSARIERGLRDAVRAAGLTGPNGQPLRVVSHQLRHTYATALANAGMSVQALMSLLGHRTPEMTLRYAALASPTLRRAYDEAVGKVRPRIPVALAGRPALPDKVGWLASEMLKTRIAHGYCARELVAEACPYANVCESCANFVTTQEFAPVLERQLADVRALRDDARARGWDSEVSRHHRVIASLEGHLRRLGDSR
ncbi:MAG: tyrosine-type recombinase/integrase [Actinobacteria bacterium]|nr:tyrosine-type recombinase/integrase [Actinomycetota bacterium]